MLQTEHKSTVTRLRLLDSLLLIHNVIKSMVVLCAAGRINAVVLRPGLQSAGCDLGGSTPPPTRPQRLQEPVTAPHASV